MLTVRDLQNKQEGWKGINTEADGFFAWYLLHVRRLQLAPELLRRCDQYFFG
jgi:hypothetical protein